jgi:hypothetical protein
MMGGSGLPSAQAVGTYRTIFHSPDDTTTPAGQSPIVTEIVRLINNAPLFANVRISIYWIAGSATGGAGTIAAAIAARPDLNVEVISDSAKTPVPAERSEGLIALMNAVDAFYICPGRVNQNGPILHESGMGGCLDGRNRAQGETDNINHSKFILIAKQGVQWVVGQMSVNWRDAGLVGVANDLLVIENDEMLHDAYRAQFNQMKACAWKIAPVEAGPTGPCSAFPSPQEALQGTDRKLWSYPRSGSLPGADPVWEYLDHANCSGRPTPDDVIRIALNDWHGNPTPQRQHVADKLIALAGSGGCNVRIVLDVSPNNAGAFNYLNPHPNLTVRCRSIIHHKFYAIDDLSGPRVMTGSSTLSNGSLLENDETQIRVKSSGLFAAYQAQFQALWKSSSGANCET